MWTKSPISIWILLVYRPFQRQKNHNKKKSEMYYLSFKMIELQEFFSETPLGARPHLHLVTISACRSSSRTGFLLCCFGCLHFPNFGLQNFQRRVVSDPLFTPSIKLPAGRSEDESSAKVQAVLTSNCPFAISNFRGIDPPQSPRGGGNG